MDEKKTFENGVHDITNADYHHSAGVSRSGLIEFKRSPYHYFMRYVDLLDNSSAEAQQTSAFFMGSLVHTLVLEPHKFEDEYVIKPDYDRRTNVGKEAYGKFMTTLWGRTVITNDQFAEASRIANAITGGEVAYNLLFGCEVEKSIYFTHQPTGIQCKVRPDAWNGSLVVDIKTSLDASPRAFQASAAKYGYFLQAGMIHEALKSVGVIMDKFVFIVVEKTHPYAVGIYVLDNEALQFGIDEFNHLMKKFELNLRGNSWPAYPLQLLKAPVWAVNDLQIMENEE